MMIKVGNTAIINVTGIDRVSIETHFNNTGPWWHRELTKSTNYILVVQYRNMDEDKETYRLGGYSDPDEVLRVKDEVIHQIKEVEAATLTTTLENAIRGS